MEARPAVSAPLTAASGRPHFDKLRELATNFKLPEADRERIEAIAIPRYEAWIAEMDAIAEEGDAKVAALVRALNDYKRFLALDLVWDSPSDFLYRQRGQLKLDGSVLEEFLPRLADPRIVPGLVGKEYEAGPRRTFAAAYFATSLVTPSAGAGLTIRTKDQDFTISRPAYIVASHDPAFPAGDSVSQKVYVAFVAAECKTNLDKTMFQEAVATAHDLKVAIPGARYYLVCEWVDMRPINTAGTDIDEVLILRGKRMNSNVRSAHGSVQGRSAARQEFVDFLDQSPVRLHVILRLVQHLRDLFDPMDEPESTIIDRGYF